MTLDLRDTSFAGPALPEPYVEFDLERQLQKLKLLPKSSGAERRALQGQWEIYRRKLRKLGDRGGQIRVFNHVIEPIAGQLGYAAFEKQPAVSTREGMEDGGVLLERGSVEETLRCWAYPAGTDLDAPAKRGRAYRFSPNRVTHRVLAAAGERVGLLTNGEELRILLSDPARPESHVSIRLDSVGGWRAFRRTPDSLRLLIALTSPTGVVAVPELVEQARLSQTRVTEKLREQARLAVEGFVQEILDDPENRDALDARGDISQLAGDLWHEGLVFVYRLLFIFKLESARDPARAFSFASTTLWRNTYSPNTGLAPHVRAVLDEGAETGHLLQQGLRTVFQFLTHGLASSEIRINPLGGSLFGPEATPLLDSLEWGEKAVARLLDRLLWTPSGKQGRQRVYYGPLDVEDLGRVYEALLELEPGIATEPMCRLRRAKLEVVVPIEQGEKYRPQEENSRKKSGRTKVLWIEEIPTGKFYLRVGLGRKASGSYYTPQSFVRFLVQETLGPLIDECSPRSDPDPAAILRLKVLDPAMGSGHFLVEACRFLGEKLYEACRLCDQIAAEEEKKAEETQGTEEQESHRAGAREFLQRVIDLPDPDDELVTYLPSRAPEGEESGLSQTKAEALCRRLVAVHCLYGVDKNILAVELAKLSLWIESHAEGLPLTFMDHRLVLGDSVTGPFLEHLVRYPSTDEPMDDLLTAGLRENLSNALETALSAVQELEASVGTSLSEHEAKQAAKAELDRGLIPFRLLAAAWVGGVMLGAEGCDDQAYAKLATRVAENRLPDLLPEPQKLLRMIATGLADSVQGLLLEPTYLQGITATEAPVPLPLELLFPEVFYPDGEPRNRSGFSAVLGNPPWDTITIKRKEWFANFRFDYLDARGTQERARIEESILADSERKTSFGEYVAEFDQRKRINDALFQYQKVKVNGAPAGRFLDEFRIFMERNAQVLGATGRVGVVVPSAFHANEGATGVRRLYLRQLSLECCFSFENRRRLFEIDSRFKFALVVAAAGGASTRFPCAFYLHNPEWLFGDRTRREVLYSLDLLERLAGESLRFPEVREPEALSIVESQLQHGVIASEAFGDRGLVFATNPVALNLTKDAGHIERRESLELGKGDSRLEPARSRLHEKGFFTLWEGKAFHQFDDTWEDDPPLVVPIRDILENRYWRLYAPHYHTSLREVTCSTNERTVIATLLPPGGVNSYTAISEREPRLRRTSGALEVIAVLNSFSFDFVARLFVQTHLTLGILQRLPWCDGNGQAARFLAHSACRLICRHSAFAHLWREQFGKEWRERQAAFEWPVLSREADRRTVRFAVDGVVAKGYGLSREQYRYVLSTFSHASDPEAPQECLSRFDELREGGEERFFEKYDPYWEIPVSEQLPEVPVDLLPVWEAREVAEPEQPYLTLEGEQDAQ